MERMLVICRNCGGIGKTIIKSGFMKKEETCCTQCNGKGYTEYAVFTVEEAEAILKHCGLSTEG